MRTSRCVRAAGMETSFMEPPSCAYVAQIRAAHHPPNGASGRGVFARLAENDAGPALERQLEIHARGCEVHQCAAVIEGQVLLRPAAELLQLARIRALDPARGVDGDGIEHALHAVLV